MQDMEKVLIKKKQDCLGGTGCLSRPAVERRAPACLAARLRDCCCSPLCLSCIVYDTSPAAVFYDMHAASSGRLELAALSRPHV